MVHGAWWRARFLTRIGYLAGSAANREPRTLLFNAVPALLEGMKDVDRSPRRRCRQVPREGFLAHQIVEAPHHHRLASKRRAELRETQDDAEAEKQGEHEDRAGPNPYQRSRQQADDVSGAQMPVSKL